MHQDTLSQHAAIIAEVKQLFEQKNQDYSTSWRILRLPSFTDQVLIKAKRIRNIQEKQKQRVSDGIEVELLGIINYSILALIQMELASDPRLALPYPEASALYDTEVAKIISLLQEKNHDYGEIWRDMRVSSMVDIILMKLLRIKEIEKNNGQTTVSEGVTSGFQDIVNYAIFSLIQYREEKERS